MSTLTVQWGYSFPPFLLPVFGKKERKKNSSIGFPRCDYFAKVLGWNDIPLLLDFILIIFSHDKSADLDHGGCVMAKRKSIFRVNSFSRRVFDCPQDFE